MEFKKILQSIIDNPHIENINVDFFDEDSDGRDMYIGFGFNISNEEWLDKFKAHMESLGMERGHIGF